MKLHLHIGYPKTGSSAIQSHIFSNKGWFEKKGIYIPRAGYASGLGHAFVASKMTPLYKRAKSDAGPEEYDQLQRLRIELEAAAGLGFEQALLSWEGFALLDEGSIAVMHDALREHDVQLLAYVRDQHSLYLSAELQGLENFKYIGVTEYFKKGRVRSQRIEYLDFTNTLSHWQSRFGPRITINTQIFDRERLAGRNVVVDFLHQLGLEVDDEFVLDDRKVNPSIDSRAGALILVAQELGVSYSQLTRLARTLPRVTGKSTHKMQSSLELEDLNFLHERFSTSNRQLFERFRPANAGAGESTLPEKSRDREASASESEFDYLLRVLKVLKDPQVDIWEGGPLAEKRVARILRPPCSGWRAAGKPGVWSQGKTSDILFRLPKTHPVYGPVAVKLILAGRYFNRNSATLVTVNGHTSSMDLSSAEVIVPLNEENRNSVLRLQFEHEEPGLAGGGGADADMDEVGMAYQLQYISYDFIWDDPPVLQL